jgi:hypothetical protein
MFYGQKLSDKLESVNIVDRPNTSTLTIFSAEAIARLAGIWKTEFAFVLVIILLAMIFQPTKHLQNSLTGSRRNGE